MARGAQKEEDKLAGVPIVSKVKYLGMSISNNCQYIEKEAKISIYRNINAFKGRLRGLNIEVKE